MIGFNVMTEEAFSYLSQMVQDEAVRRVIQDACERYAKDTCGADRLIAEQVVNVMRDSGVLDHTADAAEAEAHMESQEY